MKLIIDGDHLSYRAAASCEPTKLKPFQEPQEAAIGRLDSMMHQLLQETGIYDYEFYLAGEGNWRKAIYPEYKANRKDMKRPTWLEDVREFLVTTWKAELVNDKEVDDMCGIRLTEENPNAICVSLDKDLLTVPGVHYNFVTKVYQQITPVQALRNFYCQVITGDASDNIPAFDGKFRHSLPIFVGKLLEPIDGMDSELDMYNYCLDVYSDQVSWADDWRSVLERNAKVLWIQRKEGDQWHPPGQKEENTPSL